MPDYPYFSCSRIQTFRKCPKAFEFSYVLGIEEEFETIEKHMGSSVHELFEWLYLEKGEDRLHDDRTIRERYDAIWKSYDIAAARIVKKGNSADDYFSLGLDMALKYAARVIRNDSGTSMHLEQQFDYDLGGGIIYRGIIDRVSRRKEGTLLLTDYKTGRSVPDPEKDLQLRSYTLAMFELYPDSVVEICYEDLRQECSRVGKVERRQTSEISMELRRGVDEILSAVSFPATPSSLCDWCGHLPHCPEGKTFLDAMEYAVQNNLCPRCGAPLRQRNGKFGPFLSCSNFPNCRYSRNI